MASTAPMVGSVGNSSGLTGAQSKMCGPRDGVSATLSAAEDTTARTTSILAKSDERKALPVKDQMARSSCESERIPRGEKGCDRERERGEEGSRSTRGVGA
eukprot:scaffold70406_cov24-Tisochrysis_lutea.AAC.1